MSQLPFEDRSDFENADRGFVAWRKPNLEHAWSTHGYYGSVSHNVKAIPDPASGEPDLAGGAGDGQCRPHRRPDRPGTPARRARRLRPELPDRHPVRMSAAT
jgi:hypothetical protein